MTPSGIIGSLKVLITADGAGIEKGLTSAGEKFAKFGGAIGKIGVGLAAGIATIGTGMALAVKGTINEADKLGKMAQSVGIPVEELSKLRLAADLSDVSMESLGKSLGRLSRNMSETAGGAANEASQAFKALGITVTNSDGTLKSSSQVLTEIAGKFEGFKDGAGKTALAMALFGSEGASLIPLLNAGAGGLKEMMREAEQLGIVIDEKTAKSAEAFNDNLTRLGKVKDAIILKVTSRMLPAFENMSKVFVEAAKNSSILDGVAKVLTVTLQSLVTGAVVVLTAFTVAAQSIATVAKALWQAAQGDFKGAWDTIKNGAVDMAGTVKTATGMVKDIWFGVANETQSAAPSLSDKIAAPAIQAANKVKTALESFFGSQDKRRAAMEAELRTLGMTVSEQERYRFQLEAESIAKANNITLTEKLNAEIAKNAANYGDMAQKLSEARAAWGFANSTIDRSAGLLTDVAMGAKKGSDAFKEFATSVVRDVGQMIAKFIILNSVVKPLFGGFLSGGGFGGILGLPGLGFANEGSFTVGGGTSMSDNAFVPLNLAAGERVTVDRPDSGGGKSAATTIVLQAHPRSDQSVRDLIHDLVRVSGDMPVKLKLA